MTISSAARTVLLAAGLVGASVARAGAAGDDLALLLDWFPGEYDNYEQAWQDRIDKVEEPHERIHHIFFPVSAPGVGQHVFFVQQYMNGDPNNIYRQRLYSFASDAAEQAIRLTIYSFKDEDAYRDGHLRPGIFAELSVDDLLGRPGCEVYWRLDGDHFSGYMKELACSVVSERSGKTIFITDDLRLTPDEIWIRDEAFDAEGNRVFGNNAGVHHKNRKVHYYSGWAGISRNGPALALDEDNWNEEDGEWAFTGELESFSRFVIHNEGDIVPITNDAGERSGYSVQLARLTYQNTSVPILTLKLREDSTGKTLAYSWAQTDSDRVGLNARWAQVGLTRKPGTPSFGSEVD